MILRLPCMHLYSNDQVARLFRESESIVTLAAPSAVELEANLGGFRQANHVTARRIAKFGFPRKSTVGPLAHAARCSFTSTCKATSKDSIRSFMCHKILSQTPSKMPEKIIHRYALAEIQPSHTLQTLENHNSHRIVASVVPFLVELIYQSVFRIRVVSAVAVVLADVAVTAPARQEAGTR